MTKDISIHIIGKAYIQQTIRLTRKRIVSFMVFNILFGLTLSLIIFKAVSIFILPFLYSCIIFWYVRHRLGTNDVSLTKIEEQIHALEMKYSNNVSQLVFWGKSQMLNGGAVYGMKYSFMSLEYAYLLITKGEDLELQNAFEFSLEHERGHLYRSYWGLKHYYPKKKLARWIDEVLADIEAFRSLNRSAQAFEDAAMYKIKHNKEVNRKEMKSAEELFKLDKKDHPSWEKRCKYIKMLQDHSVDAILRVVQDDYKNYISSAGKNNEGPSNMM